MSYSIRLMPVVHQDLMTARNWYNDQKAHLGEEFKAVVNKEIEYIGKFPQHYQRKLKELRQSIVTGFPYAIFYIVEEDKKQIIIFGVLYTSRDPETIRKQ